MFIGAVVTISTETLIESTFVVNMDALFYLVGTVDKYKSVKKEEKDFEENKFLPL